MILTDEIWDAVTHVRPWDHKTKPHVHGCHYSAGDKHLYSTRWDPQARVFVAFSGKGPTLDDLRDELRRHLAEDPRSPDAPVWKRRLEQLTAADAA